MKKLTSSQISDLYTTFIEVGKEIGITPNAIDKYLWEIGNTFCNRKDCEGRPLRLICSKTIKEKCE